MENELTKDELLQLYKQEQDKRAQKCWEEIQKILATYSCIIDTEFNISSRGIVPAIRIIAQ